MLDEDRSPDQPCSGPGAGLGLMRGQRIWADARLAQASVIAEDVPLLTFDVDAPVPEFDPGSHINIAVDIGRAARGPHVYGDPIGARCSRGCR